MELEELGKDCSAARSHSADAKQVRMLWGSSVMVGVSVKDLGKICCRTMRRVSHREAVFQISERWAGYDVLSAGLNSR